MRHFKSVYLKSMRNGVHFLFVKSVLDRAKSDAKVMNKAAKLVEILETAVAKEDECLTLSRKNFKSDDIKQADQDRDTLYAKFRAMVKSFLDIPMQEEAEAAKYLWQSIKDYNIDTKSNLQQETGLLLNLVADLQSPLATHVETLGLTRLVESLKQTNDRVNDMLLQRTDDRSGQVLGALRTARFATDDAYDDLVEVIDALAILEGVADYASFINYVNTEITQYMRNAMNRKATSSQPLPGTEGGTPDDGGTTGGTEGGGTEGGDTGTGSDTGGESSGGSDSGSDAPAFD